MASSAMSLEINYRKLKSFIFTFYLFIIGFSPPTPSFYFVFLINKALSTTPTTIASSSYVIVI